MFICPLKRQLARKDEEKKMKWEFYKVYHLKKTSISLFKFDAKLYQIIYRNTYKYLHLLSFPSIKLHWLI